MPDTQPADQADDQEVPALRSRLAALERQTAEQSQLIADLRAEVESLRASLERAEADLDASRHFGQRITDQVPALVYLFDMDQGKSLYVNHGLYTMLGYTPDEIRGIRHGLMGQLLHPDDFALLPGRIAQMMAMGDLEVFTWEYRARHRDGSLRWLSSRDSIFARAADGRPTQILGVAIDITARKQAEQDRAQQTRLALLRAEVIEAINWVDNLQAALQACAQAFVDHLEMAFARIWLLDETRTTLILAASAGSYTHLDGAHSRIPVGSLRIGQIAQECRPLLINHVADDPLISDPEWALREGIVGFAGYPLLIQDRLIGVIGMFARQPIPDLVLELLASVAAVIAHGVEHRRSERALRESEARLRTILEEMPVLLNAADQFGNFVVWNRECERVTGYAADEVIGQPGFLLKIYPDSAYRARMLEEWSLRGRNFHNWELELIDRNGNPRLIAWSNISERFSVPGWYSWSVGVEVTERKRFERTLQQLNNQLEERVRRRTLELEVANRELESFSYSVSHDLRAPLRSIDGFSRAVLEDYADRLDADGRSYLERICAATMRMSRLIDDLLNLSRVARANLQRATVDLSHMAEQIIADLRQAGPARSVTAQITPGLVAYGDAQLLRIALENLLANAWKFTGRKAHAAISFGAISDPEGPIYVVRDDGAGFDMTYADRLFGAFQRLHGNDEFPGTGVGLATVQRIIHRHGGRIWAVGAVDQGATFCFTLAGEAKGDGG